MSLSISSPSYVTLRALARRLMTRERDDHTLEPTALAHEAYLRLGGSPETLPIASRVMREVLIDHARRRSADKRGGGWNRRRLHDDTATTSADEHLLDVDEALTRLAETDAEAASIVEMRFFGGLTECEIAAALGVSDRSVRRTWRAARAFLARELAT